MKFERIIKNQAEAAKGGVSISEMQNNLREQGVNVSEKYIIKVLSERWGLKFSSEEYLDTEDSRFIELFGSSEY